MSNIRVTYEHIRVHTSNIRLVTDTYGNMRVIHEYIGYTRIHTDEQHTIVFVFYLAAKAMARGC